MPPNRKRDHSETPDLAFERGLPSNPDAEKFTLGSVLLNDNYFQQIDAGLSVDDFSLEKHRRIFLRMGDLREQGQRIDRITLADELMRQGQLESVDGLSYLISLDEGLPELSNLDGYIRIVKEKANLRRIIFDAQKRIDQALQELAPSGDIAAAGIEVLQEIQRKPEGDDGKTAEEIVTGYPGGIGAFLDPTLRARGLPTGFSKFDEMTNGLHAGELTIIGARPGMGKSALLLNIAAHLCLHPKQRRAVSIFSLEMTAASLLTRMMCSEARVDAHKFRSGFLNADERRRLQQTLWDITQSRLRIYDKFGITMPQMEYYIRRDVKEYGCSMVGIDYLQLIGVKKEGERRDLDIASMTRRMKILCGPSECNIPFVALSQLSRANEKRPGGNTKPQLSDLRESGSIENDADNVHLIHRASMYQPDRTDLRGLADLIIAKQRNGSTGKVPLAFIGSLTKFENMADDAEQSSLTMEP